MAKLSVGIVGLPNVGKSTLFNALTKKSVLAANYPFATIDPSVGVVPVPDERLYMLADFSKTQATLPAVVEFVDIAGLVKGASAGEGLGNKFLTNIRETDAILQLVRIFDDGSIIHVDNKIDPLSDIEVINLELIIADQETVSKRLGNLAREIKKGDKKIIAEHDVLVKIDAVLAQGKLASKADLNEEEKKFIEKGQQFFQAEGAYAIEQSTKPQTVAFGLNNSPIGLAAWIIEKFNKWSDNNGNLESRFTKDELLVNISIYWFTQTIGSSMRVYYESAHNWSPNGNKKVEVPTAFMMLEKDIAVGPREWEARTYNIGRWNINANGGHFGEWEEPKVIAADIIAFKNQLK